MATSNEYGISHNNRDSGLNVRPGTSGGRRPQLPDERGKPDDGEPQGNEEWPNDLQLPRLLLYHLLGFPHVHHGRYHATEINIF